MCARCAQPIGAEDALRCSYLDGDGRCPAIMHAVCIDADASPCERCAFGATVLCREHAARVGFQCAYCETWHGPGCRAPNDTRTGGPFCLDCTPALPAGAGRSASPSPEEDLRRAIRRLVEDATRDELVDLERLVMGIIRATQHRVPLSHERPPLSPLANAVERASEMLVKLESPIEARFVELLATDGLAPDWDAQRAVAVNVIDASGPRRVVTTPDFAHRWRRVLVYCDGHTHGNTRDRERDNELTERLWSDGWRVIRLSGRQLYDEPQTVLARVREALLSRRRTA